MKRAQLKELGFITRDDAMVFLKKLWREENVKCPICGNDLELLHKYVVTLTEQAENDLRGIFEYIAFELLSPENAAGQLDRIEEKNWLQ